MTGTKPTWAILTGEYPPQPGGVSDYTRLVAEGLAGRGENVHVFAPAVESGAGSGTDDNGSITGGPQIHRLRDGFAPRGLAALGDALDHLPPPRRLLVQYVPHAFGMKAMNVPLCHWLIERRGRRDELWVMFHEVHTPFGNAQLRIKHNTLAAVTRAMARLLARRADRLLVSTTAWTDLLGKMLREPRPITWLPIPSNLPTAAQPEEVERLRRQFTTAARPLLVGHFGSFGPAIGPMLEPALRPLLRHPRCHVLLMGRGSRLFRSLNQLHGTAVAEDLSPQGAADHLAACDVLLQPYPDGATTRRSSLMAGLALGVPVVTTEGRLTEPFWRETRAVALAPADAPAEWAAPTLELLDDPAARAALGRRGRALYAEHFAVEHTLDALLHPGDAGGSGASAAQVTMAGGASR